MKSEKKLFFLTLLIFLFIFGINLQAQDKSSGLLTVERIFASREFAPESFGPVHWLKDGSSYTVLENSATIAGSKDIVLYQPPAEPGKFWFRHRFLFRQVKPLLYPSMIIHFPTI